MLTLKDFQLDTLQSSLDPHTTVLCIDCGLIDYQEALSLQLALREQVIDSSLPALLLICEHPAVITLGLHKQHNQLLYSVQQLESLGIEVVPTRRGGGSTAHNPGQLVLYPIMRLASFNFRIATFVHAIEQLGMHVLQETGISSNRKNRYPGLWVHDKKIASLGTQIHQGVSMHGIAINLYNDLTIFDYIVPCGLEGVAMTNVVQEGGRHIPIQKLKEIAESCWASLCESQKQ